MLFMMEPSTKNLSFLPQQLQRNILNFLPHQNIPTDLLSTNTNENDIEYQKFIREGIQFLNTLNFNKLNFFTETDLSKLKK